MRIRKKNLILDKVIKFHNFRGCEYISDFLDNRFKGEEVIVYFDPDVDGLLSGYFACKMLSMLGIKFTWYINSNREHGFFIPLDKIKGKNILAVDFLIPENQLKDIVDAGCNILSLDHHENGDKFLEYESNGKKGIVINNQYGFEDEDGRYLSGAGVVFESFITYMEEFNTRENRAIVGITLLSDIRDIENINARLYLQDLYTHPYKGYIGYLLDNTLGEVDYNFGIPRLDRNYVDYTLSPIINSCLRFNKQDLVVEFILGSGFIDRNYRDKQKKLIVRMMENAKVLSMTNLNVVIVDKYKFKGSGDEDYLSNFIGYLASQYLDGHRSSIAYLVDGKDVGRASFRGRVTGLNYLDTLVNYVNGIGHGPAFGIRGLKPSKELFQKINEECKSLEENEDFSVGYITTKNLSMTANQRGYDIGVDNMYCLSQHRQYIKYNGTNIKKHRTGAKYTEYSIDGVLVMCFDNDLKPEEDLIMPILERGVLCFYLNKKFSD